MGLFSKKPADSKARIEELKKKIQAEQAAYANPAGQAPAAPNTAPAAPPAQPAAAPSAPPAVPPQPPSQPQTPPAPQAQQYAPPPPPPPPAQQTQQGFAQPVYEERQLQPPRRRDIMEDMFEEEDLMDEIKTGIILDLGEGMSLNLPIRSKMRLDEFLHIADKVRELQRLQR